ncbi:protein phosphatase 2C domain-containing protein [Streptomyces cyaneofuscatus]|uniref:protein phosphatase 2C domain-containing protein n=1 Tax=Streptomyces cyaneofuscatus TaxID=66883 RepID=UPI00379D362C
MGLFSRKAPADQGDAAGAEPPSPGPGPAGPAPDDAGSPGALPPLAEPPRAVPPPPPEAPVAPLDPGSPFVELPTAAPRVGHVPGHVIPRLAPLATGLPSVRVDAGLLGGRWLAGASTTGLSHLKEGTTGQDVYRYAAAADGSALVLAVCDGLGSRPTTSQIGSAFLAAYACEALAAVGAGQLAAGAETALREALVAANFRALEYRSAAEPDLTDRDLACTALFCLLPLTGPDGAEDPPAHFLRVGDGNAFTLSGETYAEVFAPGDGPANIVLASLPHPAPESLIEYREVPLSGVGAVVLATDGLASDVFDSAAVRSWLAATWQMPCGPARMLDALRYRRQGSHDDRTALVAWSTRLSAAAAGTAATAAPWASGGARTVASHSRAGGDG